MHPRTVDGQAVLLPLDAGGSPVVAHIVQAGWGDVRLKQAGRLGLNMEGVAPRQAQQVWVPAGVGGEGKGCGRHEA